jgi:DNA modification methylase
VETIAIGPGNEVYNGHQRLNVWASEFGDIEVDVRVASRALSEKEREKLTVFLHKGAAGEWDFDKLANEFELDDLLEWGWTEKELDIDLWAGDPPDDPGAQMDRAEELREKWGVETGQLWQLGEHRLICGDCTDKGVVDRVMDGEKAGLLVTSPPYFNQREYSQWKSYDDYLLFVGNVVNTSNSILSDNAVFVTNIGSDEPARRWMPSDWWCIIRDSDDGWLYRECIAWVKSAAVWSVPRSMHIENGHYFPAQRWEVMLVVSRGKHPLFDIEDRNKIREFDENVWNIGVVTGGEQKALGHNAPYPIEIPERFVMVYTQKGATVYDPFLGSGTTLIACERLHRKCRAIEISPAYCAVAIQRWVDMTGGEPSVIQGDIDV